MAGGLTELPEGQRGRILALALLATVLAVLWVGVLLPITDWYAEREDNLAQQALLAQRMAQIAAQLPELRQRAASREAQAPVPVLDGESDAVAGASLQQKLQQIASQTGATLTSLEMLPGEQRGSFRRIGVRVSVAATWPVIVRLLDAVTTGSPRLLVNDLQIQGGLTLIRGADPVLSTSMIVFGFRAGTAS